MVVSALGSGLCLGTLLVDGVGVVTQMPRGFDSGGGGLSQIDHACFYTRVFLSCSSCPDQREVHS